MEMSDHKQTEQSAGISPSPDKAGWHNFGPLPRLREAGRCLVRHEGRQIAVFETDDGLFAVNNLCPHEGYPLMEGSLKEDCKLICNWHCWVFDLTSGKAEVGRDPVWTWPVERRGEDVWIDLTPPPAAERLKAAQDEIDEAFDDYDYDRLARGLARVHCAGGDMDAVLRKAFMGKATGLELGFSHPHAALCDWFLLGERLNLDGLALKNTEKAHCSLVPALEVLAHLSYDVKMRRLYPLPRGTSPWDEAGFLDAMEAQDEAQAMAFVRGALSSGIPIDRLCDLFAQAAVSHVMNLGHPLIFVTKLRRLAKRFDADFIETLACKLVRYFCAAGREDLTPEFRALKPALDIWGEVKKTGEPIPPVTTISGRSMRHLLDLFSRLASSHDPHGLHEALTAAAALNMLRFRADRENRADVPVSETIGWLDFTHALTFAQAVHEECARQPDLWPAALAQMACFVGRHNRHLDLDKRWNDWIVDDADTFLIGAKWRLLNHDEAVHIFAVHWVKTTLAVEDLVQGMCSDENKHLLLAALNRFLHSPMRTRSPQRSAYQAWSLVMRE